MGLNFYDYDGLQPKLTPPNISAGIVPEAVDTKDFGKYHLPAWLPSGDGKATVLGSSIATIGNFSPNINLI